MTETARMLGITVKEPYAFGIFHILCLVLLFALGFFLVRRLDFATEKTFRRAMLFIWIVLVALDLYKQISYDLLHIDEGGNIFADYNWYSFPFQLCSSPIYILPFIAFMRGGKVRDGFIGFLAFFSFVGGVFVLLFPETCFTERLYVNIQTMLHHGMQVIISILLVRHYRRKMNIRLFNRGFMVFLSLVGIAFMLNLGVNMLLGDEAYGFNMFYIGPFYLDELPALSPLTELIPYPVFLIGYIALITGLSYLSYLSLFALVRKGGRVSECEVKEAEENEE